MNKLTYFSTFSGVGGFEVALHKVFPDVTCLGFSEIDKYAISVYLKHFPNHKNYGDITKIDIDKLPDFDLLVGGFPCFSSDTLITTQRGLIPIKDAIMGDLVLSHTNTFKKVIGVQKRVTDKIYKVQIQGSPINLVTKEHPYYVREMKRIWDNDNRTNKRIWSKPKWKSVEDLTKNDFIGFSINQESKNDFNLTNEECWLIGRYIADGYICNNKRKGRINSYNHQIVFCVGKKKLPEFVRNVKSYHIGISEERTVYKIRIINQKFMEICKNCGRGAINKIIPNFIINLPPKKLEYFLDGYMSGDGCFSKNKFKASSISKTLIYGLGQVISKVYRTPYSIDFTKRNKTTTIEGRVVKQHNSWQVAFNKISKKQNQAIFINGILWQPFRNKQLLSYNKYVYNLEVEKDNSYTANNCIVHNCQDLSVAKKNRKGLTGERSGLFYNMVEIIKKKKPKWIIVENVASMSNENKEIISKELGKAMGMEYLPYVMVNASLVSAQSRKRLFWTNFPITQPKDRGILLKNILENGSVVREKSYAIDANYYKGINSGSLGGTPSLEKGKRQTVRIGDIGSNAQAHRIYSIEGKSVSLTGLSGGQGAKTGLYAISIQRCGDRNKKTYSLKEKAHCLSSNPMSDYVPKVLVISGSAKRTRDSGYKETEIRKDGKANALTSVQTDSLVSMKAPNGKEMEINLKEEIHQFKEVRTELGKKNRAEYRKTTGLDSTKRGKGDKKYVPQDSGKANCITTGLGVEGLLKQDYYIRKLTPIETERLQCFPDNYSAIGKDGEVISNTQRYRQMGNAVNVEVVKHILKCLKKSL